jgi:hypothetical protein
MADYKEICQESSRLALKANAFDVPYIGLVRDSNQQVTTTSASCNIEDFVKMILAAVAHLHYELGAGPQVADALVEAFASADWGSDGAGGHNA